MVARKDGRGERQKQAPRTVGGQVAGPETPQGLSEDVLFDSNEKEVSAQSVGRSVKSKKAGGRSGAGTVEDGPVGTAEVPADDKGGRPEKRGRRARAPEVRLEISVGGSDESQRDWVFSLMLGKPMERLMVNEARRD